MSSKEKQLHDRVASLVASQRLPYPDSDHPTWKTYLNEPEQTMGLGQTNPVYPDMIVVDTSKNQAVILGEVETEDTVTVEHSSQWADYSSKCNTLYLYVPYASVATAKEIILRSGIKIAGLRSYYFDQHGSLIISNA
jgi:hypothetical protein